MESNKTQVEVKIVGSVVLFASIEFIGVFMSFLVVLARDFTHIVI